MDLPQPPPDVEAKNIIHKLAQFVARNGPEFEQMTKEKQQGNPKFSFLYGGEYFNYYQYRVTSEQAILKVKGIQQPPQQQEQQQPLQQEIPPAPPQIPVPQDNGWNNQTVVPTLPPNITTESLLQQQSALNEQIQQSEANLKAQHEVLKLQEQTKVDDTIKATQLANFVEESNNLDLSLETLDSMLQPIMDTCTKDSISTGKAWILQRAVDEKTNNFFAKYLLFNVRKNVSDLKRAVEEVVVPMFCNVAKDAKEDQQTKLNKLLALWESKNAYFDSNIVAKLKQPDISWELYRKGLISTYSIVLQPLFTLTKTTYANYQNQHDAYVQHAITQIQALEEQKTLLAQQKAIATMLNMMPSEPKGSETNQKSYGMPQPPDVQQLMNPQQTQISSDFNHQNINMPPLPPGGPPPPPNVFHQMSSQPQNFFPMPGMNLPDLSRPPPGMWPPNVVMGATPGSGTGPAPAPGGEGIGQGQSPAPPPPAEISREELIPSLAYYDLPAGLMVPLINLADSDYQPLDSTKLRIPPPTPPSDRLIQAVKAYYAAPGHDSPRDSEGWEKLGLYEYYRAKSFARKHKEEEIASGKRERTPPPEAVIREKTKSPTPPPKRRYQSRSRSKSKEKDKERDRGDRDNNRDRDRSPMTRFRRSPSPRRRSPSPRRRSPSPRRHSPPPRRGNRRGPGGGRRRERSRSRSRSRSSSPVQFTAPRNERSPTPPSFLGGAYGKNPLEKLDESNKGHQMLRKMGWGGAGLGAKEQGIEQPISGGEVREREDLYKGVGVSLNDPYENFRKSKKQAFISRMKERAEERKN